MTSHLLETVRDIPLNDTRIPEDDESSGFPFDDRDFDRDRSHSSFRSQLNDIARRHPEFAEHLNIGGSFPFRSHTLGRHPRRGSDAEKPSGSQDAEFRRQPHDRAFSRFDNFDFPFGKYFDEDVPDFYEAGYKVPERHPQYAHATQQRQTEEPQPQQQQSQPSSPQPAPSGNAEKPPQVPQAREGARKQNIQQSNTVDLGQKQEPVDENRGQRSMSAPPENRSTGQRFVSSINIPIQRPGGGGGDMGARTSTQTPEPHQQSNKPNERVIPIHVEGRDEPIIPKNVNTTFTQPPPQPQPQGERIFGRNPTHFTQFVNKGEPQGMTPEEHYRQQQQQYQKQQQQNFQQQSQQQQQNQNVPEEPEVETEQQPQSQSPLSAKQTQLDQIQNIQKDVSELMNKVEKFNGKPRDKEYMYLDEMLTRNLLKLDSIMSEGKDNIKQARKEAIKCIEGCIGILEAKANANLAVANQKEQKKMETNQTTDENQPEEINVETAPSEKAEPNESSIATEPNAAEQPQAQNESAALEVSGIARAGSVANITPMEVTTAEVPAPAQNETHTQEKKEEVTLSTENSEQGGGDKKQEDESNQGKTDGDNNKKLESKEINKHDEVENKDTSKPEENTEVTPETTSQNMDEDIAATPSDDKKEKKKGKKKEKTDKK